MLALAIRYGRELTIPFNFLQLNAWGLFLSLHSSKLKDRLEKGGGKDTQSAAPLLLSMPGAVPEQFPSAQHIPPYFPT